jgi:putative addiction module CopG family antidote
MPYGIIRLSRDSYESVRAKVESGRYANADELMRAALRALQREEAASAARGSSLGIAEGDVFRKLWEAANRSSQFLR